MIGKDEAPRSLSFFWSRVRRTFKSEPPLTSTMETPPIDPRPISSGSLTISLRVCNW